MMKLFLIIILSFYSLQFVAFSQTIPVKLFVDSTMEKNPLSSINKDEYFKGISISMILSSVRFDSIAWFPKTNEMFLSGKTLDLQTEEALPNMWVSIGSLDSLSESFKLIPTYSTITDSLGAFQLKRKVGPEDKLLFTGIGFTALLFHIDWLITNLK